MYVKDKYSCFISQTHQIVTMHFLAGFYSRAKNELQVHVFYCTVFLTAALGECKGIDDWIVLVCQLNIDHGNEGEDDSSNMKQSLQMCSLVVRQVNLTGKQKKLPDRRKFFPSGTAMQLARGNCIIPYCNFTTYNVAAVFFSTSICMCADFSSQCLSPV